MHVQERFRPDMQVSVDPDVYGGGLPVAGAGPSEATHMLNLKQQMMANPENFGFPAAGAANNAIWTMGDSDVALARSRQKQLQQAGFFEYISTMVDIREPGMLSWLNELVPEYAEAQMAQLKSNQELYAMATKIKHFGINSREDLMFQYMLDTGQIRDTRPYETGVYIPGWMAPQGSIGRGATKSTFGTFQDLGDFNAPGQPDGGSEGWWNPPATAQWQFPGAAGSAAQRPDFT